MKRSSGHLPEDHGKRRLRREDLSRNGTHFLRGEFFVDFREQAVGVGGVAEEELDAEVDGGRGIKDWLGGEDGVPSRMRNLIAKRNMANSRT